MDLFSTLKVNFKNLLSNSLITENLFVATVMGISKNTLKHGIESDIALTKVQGTSPNIFYGLEAYSTL